MVYTGIIIQNMSVFRISLFQSWHASGLSATKISTWYLILQKCIFTNTRVSFDRKATSLVTIHRHYPNNSVLPPASFALPTRRLERQQRLFLLELGLSGWSDSALPKCICSLGLIHMLPERQPPSFATWEWTTQLLLPILLCWQVWKSQGFWRALVGNN